MTKEEYALEWLQYAKNDLKAERFLLGMKALKDADKILNFVQGRIENEQSDL